MKTPVPVLWGGCMPAVGATTNQHPTPPYSGLDVGSRFSEKSSSPQGELTVQDDFFFRSFKRGGGDMKTQYY